MSNLQDKKRKVVNAGVAFIWYTDMDNVSQIPSDALGTVNTSDINSSEDLEEIDVTSGTAEYSGDPDFSKDGLKYAPTLTGENLVLTKEKDNQLDNLQRGKRLLVFFIDNHGNYRFIVNARILTKVATGLFANGKPSYNIQFACEAQATAYYFTGTATVNADRTLTLS